MFELVGKTLVDDRFLFLDVTLPTTLITISSVYSHS